MRRRLFLTAMTAFGAFPVRGEVPSRWQAAWPRTNFDRMLVDPAEIRSGGVPKDGIPALDGVSFGSGQGIPAQEPVVTVALDGAAERAYPVRYLMWHEIANDHIEDVPVAVTYCPLCNSALVFDRRVDGRTLSFGVTGMLRHSDLIMYDRETESWWQQIEGRAILGALAGTELRQVVSWMEPLAAFLARSSDAMVMDEPRGARSYGRNPYRGYDTSARPFLYDGSAPPHGIEPLARVVKVGDRAWPLSRFDEGTELREAGLRLVWAGRMASALDAGLIADGREVAAIRVFDEAGRDVPHEVVFAFAFHAFEPEGVWMLGR
ncbi:MAG: DUF3179 domain-containing protein [Pseudomonadota bacterium]